MSAVLWLSQVVSTPICSALISKTFTTSPITLIITASKTRQSSSSRLHLSHLIAALHGTNNGGAWAARKKSQTQSQPPPPKKKIAATSAIDTGLQLAPTRYSAKQIGRRRSRGLAQLYELKQQEKPEDKIMSNSVHESNGIVVNGLGIVEQHTFTPYHHHKSPNETSPASPPSSSSSPQLPSIGSDEIEREYRQVIKHLNDLQSNTQVVALAKYKKPETILPLFSKQLKLAGIDIDDLNKLNAIHISGTKGKGSTCAFLESILLSLGPIDQGRRNLKVASYNSPHLVHVTERIRINGKPIDRALFVQYFYQVFDRLKKATELEHLPMPSYFSFLTILAFHIFLQEKVDCAIIEVGIGGEYDPTNIIKRPVACAITTLDLDHTNILGNTIKSIAWTKAGIIKPGVPMFTVEHEQKEAADMIRARARQRDSAVYFCKPLDLTGEQQRRLELGIQGPAQAINASIACQLASYLIGHLGLLPPLDQPQAAVVEPEKESVYILETNLETLPRPFLVGLERSRLPGRCQIIPNDNAIFFLDGAHTKKSMENCLSWFMEASPRLEQDPPRRILMINIIGDRNKGEVLRPLLPHYKFFDTIIFTSNQIFPVSAAAKMDELADSETFVKAQSPNHEKGLENVKNNARVWMGLVQEHGMPTDSMPQLIVKPSIMESIQSCILVHPVDSSNNHSLTNCQRIKTLKRPHILATGSLHFVGAILDTIERLDSGKSA
uniref:tetrahydrofolate synthase n=1 Tax=Aceria tosichella TaxID=561515 RepID=A0A6G1SGU5_9ACAR